MYTRVDNNWNMFTLIGHNHARHCFGYAHSCSQESQAHYRVWNPQSIAYVKSAILSLSIIESMRFLFQCLPTMVISHDTM